MCIKATPHTAGNPVIFFGCPGSRSNVKEFIQGFSKDATVQGVQKCVTTDAYPTYLSEFGQNEQINHQVCLAHFLCYVFNAIDMLPGEHLAGVLKYTPEQLLHLLCEQQDSQYSGSLGILFMTMVCYKLSLIFDWDEKAWQEHQTQGSDLYELRGRYRGEHSRLLMQDIDVMLQQLAPHYCLCHGSTWGARVKGDHIGKAVAYYLNQKAQLWTFVDHPHCELSQNFIEQSAKALARVRNAALFSRSPESAIAISRILTVVHTAAANKIRDIPRYLFELCSRVRHDCQLKLRLKTFRESGGEQVGKLNYNRDELYSGYKLPEELLPENWAKAHSDD